MHKTKRHLIMHFVKPHKGKFSILLSSILITTFSGAFYPYVFGKLVDEVFYRKSMEMFFNIILLYLVLYFFNQVMHFVLNITFSKLRTSFLYDIQTALFRKILSCKSKHLTTLYSGDLVSRMRVDVEQFLDFIHWNVFYTIGTGLNLLISIGFIWTFQPWIALLSLVSTPLVVYISLVFSKKAKPYYERRSKQTGLLSSWVFEVIRGMQEIRLLGACKTVRIDYVGRIKKILRLETHIAKIEVTADRVNAFVSLMAQLALYTLSVFFILHGSLTIGGFTACVAYFNTCVSAFTDLNNKAVRISANMVSIERVIEVLNAEEEDLRASLPPIKIKEGAVSFRDVQFGYTIGRPILKGVTFQIQPRETIALVGRSGAGKSTIANLLYQLYEIDHGEITVDGVNLDQFSLLDLRGQIGIVHQETVLFDGTLRFNLCMGSDSQQISDEMLWQALQLADLSDFVRSLSAGLDTIIGSEGMSFSGGQKQRISIARLLIKDPKILVFDEATSALDGEAEEVIRASWRTLCHDRTMIVIAHKLSTILHADQVAVLQDGRIVGVGTHADLLHSCAEYATLFHEQYRQIKGISI